MINNEEAVIKLPRTKSLEKFIDEVHTNLISLHLHRPPLLYAVDAIKTREKALEKTEREKKNGKRLILEFGVGAGGTMRRLIEQFPYCSDNQNVLLYGFDSFEGLPEDWIPNSWGKGAFTQHGDIPSDISNAQNVQIKKGMYNDTVKEFFQEIAKEEVGENTTELLLIHIDCDLYSSTREVLNVDLANFLRRNEAFMSGNTPLFVAFDELIDYPTYQQHEIKALYEFLKDSNDFLECVVIGKDGRDDIGEPLRFYQPDEICPLRVLVQFRPTQRGKQSFLNAKAQTKSSCLLS